MAGETIQYQASIDLPRSDATSSMPPVIPLVAAITAPLIWFERKHFDGKTFKIISNIVLIIFVVTISTGCVGFGFGMYGSSNVDAKFQKIEYLGGEDTGVLTVSNKLSGVPQGKPIWKLTGSGTYDVTFNIETTVTDINGGETTEINTCTGVVTYPVTAYVFKDFQIVLPAK
jgi:hypothetical protein